MFRLLTIAFGSLALSACMVGPSGRAKDAPPLEAVASVDVERYMGLWYEIARYPTSFQKDCEGTTAEYRLRDDGRVDVLNTCRFGTKDGEARSAGAVARVMDGSNGARIFVNFAPIPLPAGRGNYWIIHLDEGYQHALVGEPSGRFLWMLSRTPAVTPDVRAELYAAAVAAGYDISMLKETEQR
ncbi:MAG: lipocalin family protein [Hyphomonas sp.]|uniref:lipocalin family protein n=1 Tax=Hyphomonas sp. TaxID=87 RepID=UPI0034A0792C